MTERFPKVNYWLAYPHYGIGYLMSNGCVGELIPDKTSLFFSPCRQRLLYNSAVFDDRVQGEAGQNGEPSISPPVLPGKKSRVRTKELEDYLVGGLNQE